MTQQELAEEKLRGMLAIAGLSRKPSYNSVEVCLLLGIVDRTFWRLVAQFERDESTGRLRRPDCLDSFVLKRTKRVLYDELVAFLFRNNSYERSLAVHPDQMDLFAPSP